MLPRHQFLPAAGTVDFQPSRRTTGGHLCLLLVGAGENTGRSGPTATEPSRIATRPPKAAIPHLKASLRRLKAPACPISDHEPDKFLRPDTTRADQHSTASWPPCTLPINISQANPRICIFGFDLVTPGAPRHPGIHVRSRKCRRETNWLRSGPSSPNRYIATVNQLSGQCSSSGHERLG
jgi:hypothetical protein